MTDSLPKTIGPYRVLDRISKGGMGEVFRVQDPLLGRTVALKRILSTLKEKKALVSRFVKEAQIASRLGHPSIMPVYSIQKEDETFYYTMPYIAGETLRSLLKNTHASFPSLAHIFLKICEGVAYAHAEGIVHRDLKPENIMIGKYGEVLILDWGIADRLKTTPRPPSPSAKVAGTLSYMAPERLEGRSITVQADLYALGVILYQILTLQLPFLRKTVAEFRKKAPFETLVDPRETAPYRDIPRQLAEACMKCLAYKDTERFHSVEELIQEVKHYIEGRPQWLFLQALDPAQKSDWRLQEHLFLSRKSAIANRLDDAEWVFLKVSEASFPHHLRIHIEVYLPETSQGIGCLLDLSDTTSSPLDSGYCLWLGSSQYPSFQLFRNQVLVWEAKERYLSHQWHTVRIEQVGEHLHLFVDHVLELSYAAHLPFVGGRIGLLQKDDLPQLRRLDLYGGSHNVWVHCLALPNALLNRGLYDMALQEYRRIGQSFPGQAEGREALFRAGWTLLEKAKHIQEPPLKESLHHQALKEFEKLYRTPGAPLEYLGKSLVYKALQDPEEEAKCLELALRKFRRHPLLPRLQEEVIYRVHESACTHRESAYRILLLAIRHIPHLMDQPPIQNLIRTLQTHWEALPFFEANPDSAQNIAISLAFWLNKGAILQEIATEGFQKKNLSESLLGNLLFALITLGDFQPSMFFLLDVLSTDRKNALHAILQPSFTESWIADLPPLLERFHIRSLLYLLKAKLKHNEIPWIHRLEKELAHHSISPEERLPLDALFVWGHLVTHSLEKAQEIFQRYPLSELTQERSPLHFPYGTWLYLSRGADAAFLHFHNVIDTPHPSTTALPSYFLTQRTPLVTFFYEQEELHRQLTLFQLCTQPL